MIFVTVGTHEQQFDRLVKEIDMLKKEGIVDTDVFIQTGYSSYVPTHCQYSNFIDYDEMIRLTKEADIVITHGGPGSIMIPLSFNKIPIVVPRQSGFGEHVDDHQVLFSKRLETENKAIVITNISDLKEALLKYDEFQNKGTHNSSHNLQNFVKKLDKLTSEWFDRT